jgi:serine/threonine protein kinase HipA of HipAB toxin-antitoxin module
MSLFQAWVDNPAMISQPAPAGLRRHGHEVPDDFHGWWIYGDEWVRLV